MKIGILSNPQHPQTGPLSHQITAFLKDRCTEVYLSTPEVEEREPHLPPGLDTIITLGGDGTMLRAAHLRAAEGTPILGIHMGRLGFLAEVRHGDWEASVDRLCAGDYWLEERAMIRCSLYRDEIAHGPWEALNEAVIERSGSGHMIELATYVDSGYLTTYVADGVLVATATGSTAYALSTGGPILPPELPNLLLVPICPHLSMSRTIVLASGATVDIKITSVNKGALVVDGARKIDVETGDRVEVTKSPHVTRFVRMYDRRQVYETLMERLQPRRIEKPDGRC